MTQIKITKKEGSEIEIEGEISVKDLEKHRPEAIKKLGKSITIDGFRKGHIPEAKLIEKVGEVAILEDMANRALGEYYPKIIAEHKIDPIGQPQVTITKLAPDNPLGFKITITTMPEVAISGYKEIAKKIMGKEESVEVTDKEIEDTIMEIRKMRAQRPAPKNAEDAGSQEDDGEKEKEPLPELNDDFVQSLGGGMKTVDEFKQKLKENIIHEKEMKLRGKKRSEMFDAIIDKSDITLPEVIIHAEQDRMLAEFKDNIARSGGKFEDYLTHIKKTEEELQKEWHPTATKRAKTQLILNKIATTEKISADKERLEKEVAGLMKEYTGADEARARVYVETVLINEAVFNFLESV